MTIPYYKGHFIPIQQEGRGLGSILSSIARSALPLVRTGAKFLGRQALRAGCDIGDDVLSGHTVKSSIRKRVFGEESPQEGSGIKRRRRTIRKRAPRRRRRPVRKVRKCSKKKKCKQAKRRRGKKNKKNHDIFS